MTDNVVTLDFADKPPAEPVPAVPYAELQVASNYSFLRGASSAEQLVKQAAALGLDAIGIADRNTLAGVVRAHVAAKENGIRLLVGARLDFEDGPSFLCYPTERESYGRLTRLLTRGKKRTTKGKCQLFLGDILENGIFEYGRDQVMIVLAPDKLDTDFATVLARARNAIKGDLYLAMNYLYHGNDKRRLAELAQLGEHNRIPLLATNDAHAFHPDHRPLQDILTCIREGCTIKNAGFHLFANAERHLKPPAEMARLFKNYPDAIANSLKIVAACRFSLDEMKVQYLVDPAPKGTTHQAELERLTQAGLAWRFPAGATEAMQQQVARELALIAEQGYAPYFLTIRDIVWWARDRGILCQGRGSAANSCVCYVLGITEVDPIVNKLLFARFMSTQRVEPPDIDVDFEHERREKVIQHIYEKYGRDRAALTATVITYRTKSALRDVGKVMGLSEDTIVALQKSAWGRGWGREKPAKDASEDEKKAAKRKAITQERQRLRDVGIDPDDRTVRQTLELVRQLAGAPRHLSQHTGGFVITRVALDTIVPIENAAMKDRTVIEWDKDDLAALEIFKIDILALGMLTCIRKAFELIAHHGGPTYEIDTVPREEPEIYDMLCQADSIGVFQVESRAQINMLPRLLPREFYDLVVEVAIVRPGPIQGGMVHPYLKRRQAGKDSVTYPSPELKDVLEKTLGIPLFQEQAMNIAMVGAGFSAEKADKLRRSMAAFRRNGKIHVFKDEFIAGMRRDDRYTQEFAESCFKQIEGFADYGFPEAHAASFAKLVYVSAWLKCHYPAAFAAAILNSLPMGFYGPAQLVRDARQHGVAVLPVDVNRSDWDCTLEPVNGTMPTLEDAPQIGDPAWRYKDDCKMAVRLGMRSVKGMDENTANDISKYRDGGYAHMSQLLNRVAPKAGTLEKLARADAFTSLNLDRRRALWAVKGIDHAAPLPLFASLSDNEVHPEAEVSLPAMSLGEQVADDYRALKLSLKAHPMKLLRGTFDRDGVLPCGTLLSTPDGAFVRAAGLVLIRQRPGEGTVIFITIEDETGIANIIVWNHMMEKFRKEVLTSSLLYVEGKLQREGIVTHIVADKLVNMTQTLGYLTPRAPADREPIKGDSSRGGGKLIPSSRDFH